MADHQPSDLNPSSSWSPPEGPEILAGAEPPCAPYDVVHHPEYEEDGGRIQYLTWSRPTGEGWFESEMAFMRLELAEAER